MSRKSPYLWLTVLAAWIICIAFIQPPLLRVLWDDISVPQRASLLIFLFWIDFAWLYAIYQMMLALFSVLFKPEITDPSVALDHIPAVAILYTTMNDFQENAVLSCVNQDYAQFHVFLLDDSTEREYCLEVDAFHEKFLDRTTVIRRGQRSGFKAGNLNYALAQIAEKFEFFAVCDADGVLPREFISKGITYFNSDNIAFVQTKQRAVLEKPATRFAIDLGVAVEIYWEQLIRPTERFGFTMFHGHGGIIRRSVWQEVGGFPEVVAEDLAFSTRARELGYVGVIAHDVICEEQFPPSFDAFSVRQLKYTRGTCEHLLREMIRFLRSPRINWFEKADRLLASFAMISALPFLIFLFNLVLVIPALFHADVASIPDTTGLSVVSQHISSSPLPILNRSFFLMTVLVLLAPFLPAVCFLWKNPAKLLRYAVNSLAAHLSLIFRESWDTLLVATLGINYFPVTGERTRFTRAKTSMAFKSPLAAMELVFASVLLMAAMLSNNMTTVSIPLAIGMGHAARNLSWDHWIVQSTAFLVITTLFMFIMGQGKPMGFFSALIFAPNSIL